MTLRGCLLFQKPASFLVFSFLCVLAWRCVRNPVIASEKILLLLVSACLHNMLQTELVEELTHLLLQRVLVLRKQRRTPLLKIQLYRVHGKDAAPAACNAESTYDRWLQRPTCQAALSAIRA